MTMKRRFHLTLPLICFLTPVLLWLVLLIVLLGLVGGIAAGIWLGKGLSAVYTGFYHFPFLNYVLETPVIVGATVVSLVAGLTGTAFAVQRAVRLPGRQ